MTTFSEVLTRQLRSDAGRPFITFYDDATGERVELSVTTYANWVAKVSSLLVEEHDLGRGQTLCLDLPAHWLGPVFLGAAWTVGLVVDDGNPDAVVCGPDGLGRWAPHAGEIPVLACSLLPLGVRFADELPPGVHDVGVDVWSQPDAFAAYDGVVPATEEDHAREYLSLDISAAVVPDLDAAVRHIRRYSSQHTEAIVTEDLAAARRFTAAVDSAAVLVNASTRFTDGGEFGFGAEIGISTQKLHARGPMGLPEMTSTKYVVTGDGHVR